MEDPTRESAQPNKPNFEELTDDQAYVCELVADAHWLVVLRELEAADA